MTSNIETNVTTVSSYLSINNISDHLFDIKYIFLKSHFMVAVDISSVFLLIISNQIKMHHKV